MSTDQDTLATLTTVATEMEGHLLVNILSEHGIAAVATGGFTSQFQADAPGNVRVMVHRKSLLMGKSVLAERANQQSLHTVNDDDEQEPVHSPTNEIESTVYEPWLTKFGFQTLLIGNLLAIIGTLVFWRVGGIETGGFVLLIGPLVLVAAILTRRWYVRN